MGKIDLKVDAPNEVGQAVAEAIRRRVTPFFVLFGR